MGESTYFIGFMLPTFGIICKLGGFCGPFGPRVGKFAFFDIILLKLKNLPSMSPALKVACPQSRLPSKSSALKVVCPQRRGLNVAALKVACPQCPIGLSIAINQSINVYSGQQPLMTFQGQKTYKGSHTTIHIGNRVKVGKQG